MPTFPTLLFEGSGRSGEGRHDSVDFRALRNPSQVGIQPRAQQGEARPEDAEMLPKCALQPNVQQAVLPHCNFATVSRPSLSAYGEQLTTVVARGLQAVRAIPIVTGEAVLAAKATVKLAHASPSTAIVQKEERV